MFRLHFVVLVAALVGVIAAIYAGNGLSGQLFGAGVAVGTLGLGAFLVSMASEKAGRLLLGNDTEPGVGLFFCAAAATLAVAAAVVARFVAGESTGPLMEIIGGVCVLAAIFSYLVVIWTVGERYKTTLPRAMFVALPGIGILGIPGIESQPSTVE